MVHASTYATGFFQNNIFYFLLIGRFAQQSTLYCTPLRSRYFFENIPINAAARNYVAERYKYKLFVIIIFFYKHLKLIRINDRRKFQRALTTLSRSFALKNVIFYSVKNPNGTRSVCRT